ncbi:MAG: FAD-binding protein, partial [Actinobacteria bacterium]|nr:FAD-binding protein [Actinomycetota bacterium]
SGVEVHRGLTLAEVLVAEGRAVGAACVAEDGRQVDVRAGAVVLATGGLGRLYPMTSNPTFMTGDGYAAGYRAGARLRDMEFVQFTPSGLAWPDELRGFHVNHELLAHPLVRVLNAREEQLAVMGPQVVRDLGFRLDLIRLFHREILDGRGTPHGGLYLDLRDVPRDEAGRLSPALWEAVLEAGIHPARELLEVAPEVHFFMGGFDVDEMGETSLPGLFAVGETAGGCHGANRLTHNAFPEVIVFAPRAGRAAGEQAVHLPERALPEPDPQRLWRWPEATDLREELRSTVLRAAGPIRSATSLSLGLARLVELRSALWERKPGEEDDPVAGLATRNLFDVAELVLRAAQARKESRGSHFREDRPVRDDARWLVNLLVEQGSEGPVLQERPVELPYLRPE